MGNIHTGLSYPGYTPNILGKVFKSEQRKFCEREPLKNADHIPSKNFKGCLPQNLLNSLLNTLCHIISFEGKTIHGYYILRPRKSLLFWSNSRNIIPAKFNTFKVCLSW